MSKKFGDYLGRAAIQSQEKVAKQELRNESEAPKQELGSQVEFMVGGAHPIFG
jgi:hypothetical protein